MQSPDSAIQARFRQARHPWFLFRIGQGMQRKDELRKHTHYLREQNFSDKKLDRSNSMDHLNGFQSLCTSLGLCRFMKGNFRVATIWRLAAYSGHRS